MVCNRSLYEQKGFTLIELMIVVGIIGILAAIAIPKYYAMCEKANESTTKANGGAIRSAMAIYYGDREGVWPTTLNNNSWTSYLMSSYLDVLPQVTATHSSIGTNPRGNAMVYISAGTIPTAPGAGWAYDSSYGRIYVNSCYMDTRGLSYTTY